MASVKKECAYEKCDKVFYGGKRAMYCCDKHGQYQRRLNSKYDSMKKQIKESK